MPVSYTDRSGTENFIIPAPLVSISKAYDSTGDGNVIGTRYTITLTGVLTADKGSRQLTMRRGIGLYSKNRRLCLICLAGKMKAVNCIYCRQKTRVFRG